MSLPTATCQPLTKPPPPQRTHTTVEDALDDDSYEWSEQSSAESTPTESKPTSFFDNNFTVDDELVARATGISLRRDDTIFTKPTTHSVVGHRISHITVPKNFAKVMPGVYRSAFPDPSNFSFLRLLGLKTILTLVPEKYPETHQHFMADQAITHFQIGIEPNKSPFITINACNMAAALGAVLDRTNHPMLIHCNKGKHRTGCVIACTRKILGWPLEDILAEYRQYAGVKARVLDERYIELFDERALQWLARRERLVPAVNVPEPFAEAHVASLAVSTRLRG